MLRRTALRACLDIALPAARSQLSAADRLQGVLWRFRAGSPLLGGAEVAPDGSVYAGTADGSLHALNSDGSFRWTLSLPAPVSGRPAVDGPFIYATTTSGQVTASRSDGTPLWTYRPLVAPRTGVVLGPAGALVYAGADGALYAVSRRGGALWRRSFAGGISAGPSGSGPSRLMVGTRSGELVAIRGGSWHFHSEIQQLGDVVGEVAHAIAGAELVAVDRAGAVRFRIAGVEQSALGPGFLVAVRANGELIWVALDGSVLRRARLETAPSAAIAVTARGEGVVPTSIGSLLVFSRGARLERQVRVANAAVIDVRLDAVRSRLIAATGDGTIAAVSIRGAGA